MPQSLAQLYVHMVFSTKHRQPQLKDHDLQNDLHAYVGGICKSLDCAPLKVGGVEDHLHTLVRLSRKIKIADFLRDLKRDSSKWLKTRDDALRDFHWQDGYGAFSLSPCHVDPLRAYIDNQEEHHRHESFQDEFRRLCRLYGLEIDERYVWD